MPYRKFSRSIVAALLAVGLTSFVGLNKCSLLTRYTDHNFAPVHSDCDLQGADRDAHLDRRECHSVPTFFEKVPRWLVSRGPDIARLLPPARPESAVANSSAPYWLEPPAESTGPRAPPADQPLDVIASA